MGVLIPGAAAKLVGVVTTTAARVAAVMEAREARPELVVAQNAAKGATSVATTRAVAAALGETQESGGTAQDGVQRGKARQPPPARLRL